MSDFLWLIDSVYAHFIKIPLAVAFAVFTVLIVVIAVLVFKALEQEKNNDDQ